MNNGGGSSWAGDLVQEKRRNKVLRESLHQVQGVEAPKRAKNLVQGKRKNKVLRESLHQAQGVGAPKRAKDLVQRKRRNKVLRESLHQVRRVGAPKRAKDLVQRKRRNKGLRGVKHHVSAGVGPSGPGDVVLPDEGTRVCDVLPVNRTMKKYKIYVTSNLNLLLAIFLILRYIFAIQNPSPGGRSAASLRC